MIWIALNRAKPVRCFVSFEQSQICQTGLIYVLFYDHDVMAQTS
jgi:hypothetical protein